MTEPDAADVPHDLTNLPTTMLRHLRDQILYSPNPALLALRLKIEHELIKRGVAPTTWPVTP